MVQRGGSVGDASLNVNPKLLVSTFPSSRADVKASVVTMALGIPTGFHIQDAVSATFSTSDEE